MDQRFHQNPNNVPRGHPPRHNFQNSFYVPEDQYLAAAFSSLNLSSPASFNFAGDGLLSFPHQESNQDLSFWNLRFSNGQMVSSVGPRNRIVGPPAAESTSDSWGCYGEDDQAFMPSGLELCDLDYLARKKQYSPYYPNTQFQHQSPMPCCSSNRNTSNFLNNKLPQQSNFRGLSDLKGRIVSLAKDQHYCRVLQDKYFSDPTVEEIEMVLSEVIDYIGDLMKNQFGNNLVQKIIVLCTEEQRSRIIQSVTKTPYQLISICLNPHGSRSVLKLMENLTCPQQVSLLMAAISPGAAALANDQNGHHVIANCLKNFSAEHNMHLVNSIAENCYGVAADKSGCCVLQICVEKSTGKLREHLVSEIIANALHLSEDPYGNYVLQHILGLKEPDITWKLLRQLEGNYMSISCNKFGSNVVEKCLVVSRVDQSSRIIMELITNPNAPMILVDPFGNFVIQSAISVSQQLNFVLQEQGMVHNALLHLIRANISSMRSNLYGKKVLAFLRKKKIQLV